MKEIDNFLFKSTKVLNEIDKKIILKSLKIAKNTKKSCVGKRVPTVFRLTRYVT